MRGLRRAARSTLFGVLQREHSISSQGKQPLIACSIVGDGSMGSPALHMRSFHDRHDKLSASQISASPRARASTDRCARIEVITIALRSSSPAPSCLRLTMAWDDISGPSLNIPSCSPFLVCSSLSVMARHIAGWRFPTEKEMRQSGLDAARSSADQQSAEPKLLCEVAAHVLRFDCPCCLTVTEIQMTDAICLCGGRATVDDVADRLRHDACDCDLVLLLRR